MTIKMIPHYFKGRKEKEGREKKKQKRLPILVGSSACLAPSPGTNSQLCLLGDTVLFYQVDGLSCQLSLLLLFCPILPLGFSTEQMLGLTNTFLHSFR